MLFSGKTMADALVLLTQTHTEMCLKVFMPHLIR